MGMAMASHCVGALVSSNFATRDGPIIIIGKSEIGKSDLFVKIGNRMLLTSDFRFYFSLFFLHRMLIFDVTPFICGPVIG